VHQHHVRRGLDVDKTLRELLHENPPDNVRHHFPGHKSQKEDHARVETFLATTGLPPRVIGWVLNQIPEESGLEWLLLPRTQDFLKLVFDKPNRDNAFEFSHYELIRLFVVLDAERSKRDAIEATDKLRRKVVLDNARESDQADLITLMKQANPNASDATLRDIVDKLNMSLSALRSKTQVEFDAKMRNMEFDDHQKTIVEKTYVLARQAQGNRRQRVGASLAPNPYFV
jgi:hypothetical protein